MDEIMMDLSQLSTQDVIDTANTEVAPSTPETIKKVIKAAKYELGARRDRAGRTLWKARMDLQYAENEVRMLDGIPTKPVGGCTVDLDPEEYK